MLIRVLYESLFFDVTTPRDVRGPGHVMHRVLEHSGVDVDLRPPAPPPWRGEQLVSKLHRRVTGRRYLRLPWCQAARAGAVPNQAVARRQPDVVLTIFPADLSGYRGASPIVYRADVTYEALAREYPEHGWGPLMARLSIRFQARACRRSTLLVTHSAWSRDWLERYGIPRDRIRVFPNTGGLPQEAVEATVRDRFLEPPLGLLFVGFDGRRKGLDIALEALRTLNETGLESRLTVCGLSGDDTTTVSYVGPFDKSLPEKLEAYADLYCRADFLLHPARFDPSPMVVAEVAAFPLPTITHDVAGLSASGCNDRNGLVLPPRSQAGVYARAVRGLVDDPERARRLGREARERYEKELSWDRFGDNLVAVLEESAASGRRCPE